MNTPREQEIAAALSETAHWVEHGEYSLRLCASRLKLLARHCTELFQERCPHTNKKRMASDLIECQRCDKGWFDEVPSMPQETEG